MNYDQHVIVCDCGCGSGFIFNNFCDCIFVDSIKSTFYTDQEGLFSLLKKHFSLKGDCINECIIKKEQLLDLKQFFNDFREDVRVTADEYSNCSYLIFEKIDDDLYSIQLIDDMDWYYKLIGKYHRMHEVALKLEDVENLIKQIDEVL